MKSVWVLVGALGIVSVTSFSVAAFMLWRQRCQRRQLADDVRMICTQQEFAVEPDEALEAMMSAAEQCPEFAEAWDTAVRGAADQLAGEIAGRQMAGVMSGNLDWNAAVPLPLGMPPEVGHVAFDHAVRTEVTRRINAMTGPGAFG